MPAAAGLYGTECDTPRGVGLTSDGVELPAARPGALKVKLGQAEYTVINVASTSIVS